MKHMLMSVFDEKTHGWVELRMKSLILWGSIKTISYLEPFGPSVSDLNLWNIFVTQLDCSSFSPSHYMLFESRQRTLIHQK